MAQLLNRATGVLVSVSDEKVARFGSEWEPFTEAAEAKADPEPAKAPVKRSPGRPRKTT